MNARNKLLALKEKTLPLVTTAADKLADITPTLAASEIKRRHLRANGCRSDIWFLLLESGSYNGQRLI